MLDEPKLKRARLEKPLKITYSLEQLLQKSLENDNSEMNPTTLKTEVTTYVAAVTPHRYNAFIQKLLCDYLFANLYGVRFPDQLNRTLVRTKLKWHFDPKNERNERTKIIAQCNKSRTILMSEAGSLSKDYGLNEVLSTFLHEYMHSIYRQLPTATQIQVRETSQALLLEMKSIKHHKGVFSRLLIWGIEGYDEESLINGELVCRIMEHYVHTRHFPGRSQGLSQHLAIQIATCMKAIEAFINDRVCTQARAASIKGFSPSHPTFPEYFFVSSPKQRLERASDQKDPGKLFYLKNELKLANFFPLHDALKRKDYPYAEKLSHYWSIAQKNDTDELPFTCAIPHKVGETFRDQLRLMLEYACDNIQANKHEAVRAQLRSHPCIINMELNEKHGTMLRLAITLKQVNFVIELLNNKQLALDKQNSSGKNVTPWASTEIYNLKTDDASVKILQALQDKEAKEALNNIRLGNKKGVQRCLKRAPKIQQTHATLFLEAAALYKQTHITELLKETLKKTAPRTPKPPLLRCQLFVPRATTLAFSTGP